MSKPVRATANRFGKVAISTAILLSTQLFVLHHAAAAKGEINADPWQMERLFSPSKSDIASEHQGHIVIYSGLLDSDVDKAMDLYFDRIEAMMFIQTIHTDRNGKPKVDPDTGEVEVADDGC